MEIIKHGDPSKAPGNQNIYRTKCPECGCEFKCNSSDRRVNYRHGEWDTTREAIAAENGYPYEVTCPECRFWFFVDCLGNSRSQDAFDWECRRAEDKYQEGLAEERAKYR